MKAIVVVIYALGAGGAERVATTLVNDWAARGYDVTVFTIDPGRSEPHYPLNAMVKVHRLGIGRPTRGLLEKGAEFVRRIWKLRSAIGKSGSDVVVSFMSEMNILALIASWPHRRRFRVVVSERSDPFRIPDRQVWRILRRVLYRTRPHAIVVQTEYARRYFEGATRARVVVIPNPLQEEILRGDELSLVDRDPVRIVTVGRLVREKRHDLLIEAFRILKDDGGFKRLKLTIFGDGPLREQIRRDISRLGLEDDVNLKGLVKEPWREIDPGDLFVLTSEFEGFPNALCEAMAHGNVVISTYFGPAAEEVVIDGVTGLLVRDSSAAAVAAAIRSVSRSGSVRRELRQGAREFAKTLDVNAISTSWLQLLEEKGDAMMVRRPADRPS